MACEQPSCSVIAASRVGAAVDVWGVNFVLA